MKQSPFYKEADLIVQMIPEVAEESCFALKGGTAINFFWRDMPRFSVDLDLTYLPIEDRDTSLQNISKALGKIAISIEKTHPNFKVQRSQVKGTQRIANSITTLSFADPYGGKLCAALDRQHPRDIFDMKVLMENEGITDDIRKAFLVYLSSHDRPMNEMIEPTRKDIRQSFEREFVGMVDAELTLDELISIREKYILFVSESLSPDERKFLITLKEGEPEWELLGVTDMDRLPAVQWKLRNIRSLKDRNKAKHAESLNRLKKKLGF
jgi:predicted nucleotidyltransferase component of viral defense system